jgi:hypothetical protein
MANILRHRKTVEKQLVEHEDLPSSMRRVLELRLGGAQAAVKKIDALLARAGDDDRVRGAHSDFMAPVPGAGPVKAFSRKT